MTGYFKEYRLPLKTVRNELNGEIAFKDRVGEFLSVRAWSDYWKTLEKRHPDLMVEEEEGVYVPIYLHELGVGIALHEFVAHGDLPVYKYDKRVAYGQLDICLQLERSESYLPTSIQMEYFGSGWMEGLTILRDEFEECLKKHNFPLPAFWFRTAAFESVSSVRPNTSNRPSEMDRERYKTAVIVAKELVADGEKVTWDNIVKRMMASPRFRNACRDVGEEGLKRSIREVGHPKDNPSVRATLKQQLK